MSESMSEMSKDAAVNDGGLLDTVFDAICELAGEDGRDSVPVRQIQVRTSLRLERLEGLLEEWECMGVICRDVTRFEVGCGTNRKVQADLNDTEIDMALAQGCTKDWRVLVFL